MRDTTVGPPLTRNLSVMVPGQFVTEPALTRNLTTFAPSNQYSSFSSGPSLTRNLTAFVPSSHPRRSSSFSSGPALSQNLSVMMPSNFSSNYTPRLTRFLPEAEYQQRDAEYNRYTEIGEASL